MKFANVEGERRQAESGLSGTCPGCGAVVIARCGEVRIWHWAHKGTRACDLCWENETEWHRSWKNEYPESWQEVHHTAPSGEKHIADVKTEHDVVLEFQHSSLKSEERRSREAFYRKMVWVVDGRRGGRTRELFFAALRSGIVISQEPQVFSIPSKECSLLRSWSNSRVPVYLDFGDSEPGDSQRFDKPSLWRLTPGSRDGMAYLMPVPKAWFLHIHTKGLPVEVIYNKEIARAVAAHKRVVTASLIRQVQQSMPLTGFARYLAIRERRRRRF